MQDIGYVRLWDVECILVEEVDGISIILKDEADLKKIRPHFGDQNFVFNYCGKIGFNSIAFIERVQFEFNHAIKFFPRYIINCCCVDSFTGMEMMGDAIDDFFSPSSYFYDRSKAGAEISVDYIYHNEIADKWMVIFEGEPITITLSYGDILSRGIASDLMLHPKLKIYFNKTTDVEYVYRVYLLVVRFLQIIRYDTKCGKLKIDLLSENDGKLTHNGCLHDFSADPNQFLKGNHDVEYGSFKPYIQRFWQFAADNPTYTFYHYPAEGIRCRGIHYSVADFMNIFAAFESECHAKQELYENIDATRVQSIKDVLVAQLDEYSKNELKQEEMEFLENAKKRIRQLGTQYGLTKKIINVYHVLHHALDRSIKYIFYLPEFRLEGSLQDTDLKKIATFLAGQRGAVAHGGFSGTFSDLDAQKIRFLEILTYAQLLKRVGLGDADIERVIGALFGCNFALAHEKYG